MALDDLSVAATCDLQAEARSVRARAHGNRVTYSPKVFIPLTMLCRDRCGYCTFAKPPARVTSPYLEPDDVAGDRPRRSGRRLPRGALHAGRASPRTATRWPAAGSTTTATARPSTTWRRCARLVRDETGLLPHANAGALGPEDLARLRAVSASQGMMLESLDPDLACHRGAPDKTPARRLATLEAAGDLAIPFTTGMLVGIGESRADRLRALEAIAAPTGRHGHVQEVIVQNFLPKPGTAMRAVPRARRGAALDDRRWPGSSSRRGARAGAAQPVRRPRAPCSTPGSTTGAACRRSPSTTSTRSGRGPRSTSCAPRPSVRGLVLAPRLTVYPEFALDPGRWLDAPPCASPCSTAPTPTGSPATTPGARAARPTPPRRVLLARRSIRAGVGRARPRLPPRPGPAAVAEVLAGVRARPGAGRGRDRDPVLGPRAARSAPSPRWPTSCRPRRGGRRRDVGGQPQHQLHQRLHVQVPLLRLLQGSRSRSTCAARPTCSTLDDITDRVRGGRGRRRHRGLPAGRHPPELRRGLLPRRDPGGAATPRQHIHIHGFTALEVTEGARRLGRAAASTICGA